MTWQILVTDGMAPEGMVILREKADVIEGDIGTVQGSIDAVIVRGRTKVTSQVMRDLSPMLKVIGRAGVGVDNIDLDEAAARGIVVVNTPEATAISVAEHTLALMLALARHIPQGDAGIRRGEWLKNELLGNELHGKMLGIIGVGRIGAALVPRAAALGMTILGYDPYLEDEELRKRDVEPVELRDLLERSDYISLHVPLTDETRSMINGETIIWMKPGSRLIVAARGGLIEETAVLNALREGHLAGVAFDVFSQEPPGLTELVAHPKVISTPHIGAQTIEAQDRISRDIAEEVLAALRKEPLRWQVA